MKIKQNLTTINYNGMSNKTNKYIVIHYTGNSIDTAYDNTKYFKSVYREASAHYFVDDNDIYQCVLDKDKAWHCGDKLKFGNGGMFNGKCTNSNSIGVEMCCTNYDISAKTEANTIELVKYLMNKYNIPVNNVIRHYDVTNKICPKPFVNDSSRWNNFKNKLGGTSSIQTSSEPNYTGKITYQTYDNKKAKWLPEVISANSSDYGGNLGNNMGGLRAKCEHGEIQIQVHVIGKGWLDWVSSKNYKKNDKNNGNSYGGLFGKNIDGVRIKSTLGYVDYRVYDNVKKKWLPWVRSTNPNEFAGNLGNAIGGIQMK